MKRMIMTILMVCMVFGMAGCSTEQTGAPATDNTTTTTTVAQFTGDNDGQTTTAGKESAETKEQGSTGDQTTGTSAEGTKKTAGSKATTTTTEKKATNKTTTTTAKKTTTTTAQQAAKKTTTTTKKKTTTKKATTTTKATSQWDKRVTIDDTKAVAERVIYHINQYRVQQGSVAATKLPGLTKVAEYRSKQLVTNFAHDATDIHKAFTAYKYGEYKDATLFGDPPEKSYYDAPCREAIGYIAGTRSEETIDTLAERIATMFKNSDGHWSYVGDPQYPYIAVGVTASNGEWYTCVFVSDTNQYG